MRVYARHYRLPTCYLAGWKFEALSLFEREMKGEFGVVYGMHNQMMAWDDKGPVDDDQVMNDGNVGSLRDMRANNCTAVGVTGVRASGDEKGTETQAVDRGFAICALVGDWRYWWTK